MDRKLDSNFVMPSVSVPVFSAINALILVAINEKIIVPFLRSKTTISYLTKSKQQNKIIGRQIPRFFLCVAVMGYQKLGKIEDLNRFEPKDTEKKIRNRCTC
ncbi:hypothetical protein LXL04_001059 [Taraxacum kok-saghyz]